ncbi:hypothetical protein [Methylobacterium sp. D54C]|jgi:hypothetical protein
MPELSLFLPLTKVDAANRLVYGLATAEAPDRAGEVCDYASTKPLYEKWSGGIAKATDGRSLGNLRAMHGKVAAGKVTQIAFNDDARQIEICAKGSTTRNGRRSRRASTPAFRRAAPTPSAGGGRTA